MVLQATAGGGAALPVKEVLLAAPAYASLSPISLAGTPALKYFGSLQTCAIPFAALQATSGLLIHPAVHK